MKKKELDLPAVRRLIRLALDEDLPEGDITTRLSIPSKLNAEAVILVKEDCVICGLPLLSLISKVYGSALSVTLLSADGQFITAGTKVALLRGSAATLLALERTMLNFLQRLSGIATYAQRAVAKSQGMKVLDTRKTMPGWRQLEKYAVRTGGATNHRGSLSDMILVKNNHIDGGGGVDMVMSKIMRHKPAKIKVEVEVRNHAELCAVLPYRPDIVMLDNMSIPQIRRELTFLKKAAPQIHVEISGGVYPARFPALKKAGVTLLSMGSLTTQATNVDISMRLTISRKSTLGNKGSKKR